ncbi:MAG: OmpA family protein [Deltaproteobacteria bacterium]|nr:OmpA family protein [Deltaproteobacteria bacterium]
MIMRLRHVEGEAVLQWQTIYCSLLLLLVVFFVMLIAHSSIDRERFLEKKNIEAKQKATAPPAHDMNQAMKSMEKVLGDLGLKNDTPIVRTSEGFKAVVAAPVLFKSGDDSLNPNMLGILDGITTIAKKNHLEIRIAGHTDDRPIKTDKFPSNWELSTMRAVNILRYLKNKGRIPSSRLIAVGYGEYHPIADNKTPEGRQKNRRIEIFFRPVK